LTARDSFVIDFDKETLKQHIKMFCDEKIPDEVIRQTFNLKDKSSWRLGVAREKVRKDEYWVDSITQIYFRPFDIQWIFFHDEVIQRTRKGVMRNMMLGENLGLVTSRQAQSGFRHVLIANKIVDRNLTGTAGKYGSSYLFPLYIYPNIGKRNLFSHTKGLKEREPNINPRLFATLSEVYKKEPTPEEICYYIYAVLYSNIYRKKYAEFLKIDFPKVPFTKDYKIFTKMGDYGKRLVDLHLLKSVEIDQPIVKFQGKNDDRVEKLKYDEKEKRVYFNQGQYFEGITEEVWQYQIGGYQVCNKWLKDRKKRLLSLDDIKHYCKIVTSLQKTIEIQKAIDHIYPEVEQETIEIENR